MLSRAADDDFGGRSIEFSPYSRTFFEDPYPVYKRLRDHAPVYHNHEIGFYALSRYRDVLDAAVDHVTYSSAKGVMVEEMPQDYLEALPMILMMDPPRQSRLRKLISKVFTPQRIAQLEPQVRALAVELLDPLAERGECDIVEEFAAVLPIEVISIMLGVPKADRRQVREWSDIGLTREEGSPEIPPVALDAMARSATYFSELIEERKKRPRDDMISLLIQVETDADDGGRTRLTDPEILGFTALISGAGNETVTKLLGNAVVLFHRYPAERAKVTGNPGRIPNAVEEALRYWPPAHIQGRVATRDVTLHGQRIPAGSRVVLLTASACRDEREFERPDVFDIDRQIPVQLALGFGVHRCLGAALARLEGRVCLEEILGRMPDFVVHEERTTRVHMTNVVGYASVPISYPPPSTLRRTQGSG